MGFIIGTAGHIDHGKTSLVKALTGQDTDRLKEEKERGISIDLGFAHLDLPGGERAGVVDVPGHERFIRNMLAGAHAIDLVLFTVAADDGVMPQTEEHLDILHLLGIRRAIFVVTKIDLVREARIREVEDEIRLLVSGTTLENSPIVRFSFVTGEGLESIRSLIADILRQIGKPQSPGFFRLPVDRVFVLQGHGLVVTGTATSGEIRVGDRVRCLPGDHLFRVRSLQVHNQAVDVAAEGQRIALNLAGQDTPALERGHVICQEALTLTSERFDAWLELRPGRAAVLKDRQRVRVHLGTAERFGRVRLLGARERIGPKQSAYCQVTVTGPVHALRGDRFIIRDETARRTLGGGVIVHPWPKKHKSTKHDALRTLERLHASDPAKLVESFIEESDDFAEPIDRLAQFLNVRAPDVEAQVAKLTSIRPFNLEGERLYSSDAKWQRASGRVVELVRDFHAAHPLAPGMDSEAVRDKLPFRMSPRLFRAFVDQLERGGTVVREGNLLRGPAHTVRLSDEERNLVERIRSLLGANPIGPPDLSEIERTLAIGRPRLLEVLKVMEREKSIVRVSADFYFLAESIASLTRTLEQRWSDGGAITPAAFRDAVATTRKYAIPLLEYFDRTGVTVRMGETRRLRRGSQP